jgi:integrase
MRQRKQNGTIVRFCDRWYLRFSESRLIDGKLARKKVSVCLGPVVGRGQNPPETIKDAAAKRMLTVNTVMPDHVFIVSDFVKQVYLPYVEQEKRASTLKGYKTIWRGLEPIVGKRTLLKDVDTIIIQQWLNQLAKSDLSKATLRHTKAWLSGVFRFAKVMGYFDPKAENPVRDAYIPSKARGAAECHAYTLEQIEEMLAVLPSPSDVVFATASYAGLRFSELSGLNWEDLRTDDEGRMLLFVSRSIWNGHESAPKTATSAAGVPIIPFLQKRLELWRKACGSPTTGPMFPNSLPDGRLNLNNLLGRVILPALNVCVHCGGHDDLKHIREEHPFERDPRRPVWRGWHACRRGLASNLKRLRIESEVIQRILRHSDVQTTERHYIKTIREDQWAAMDELQKEVSKKTAALDRRSGLSDSDRTVNRTVGALPLPVN